jgi:hypothetical protein
MSGQALQLSSWIEAQATTMALIMSKTMANQCSPRRSTIIRKHVVSKFIDDEVEEVGTLRNII